MSWVYLIGENGNEGSYKIGSTRCKDIKKKTEAAPNWKLQQSLHQVII